jgi:hypothetical protein
MFALTFCDSELLPATLNTTMFVVRSYWISKASTLMVGLFEHRLYPCVERMSPPNTLAGRALSSTSGKVHETPEDHMVAIFYCVGARPLYAIYQTSRLLSFQGFEAGVGVAIKLDGLYMSSEDVGSSG